MMIPFLILSAAAFGLLAVIGYLFWLLHNSLQDVSEFRQTAQKHCESRYEIIKALYPIEDEAWQATHQQALDRAKGFALLQDTCDTWRETATRRAGELTEAWKQRHELHDALYLSESEAHQATHEQAVDRAKALAGGWHAKAVDYFVDRLWKATGRKTEKSQEAIRKCLDDFCSQPNGLAISESFRRLREQYNELRATINEVSPPLDTSEPELDNHQMLLGRLKAICKPCGKCASETVRRTQNENKLDDAIGKLSLLRIAVNGDPHDAICFEAMIDRARKHREKAAKWDRLNDTSAEDLAADNDLVRRSADDEHFGVRLLSPTRHLIYAIRGEMEKEGETHAESVVTAIKLAFKHRQAAAELDEIRRAAMSADLKRYSELLFPAMGVSGNVAEALIHTGDSIENGVIGESPRSVQEAKEKQIADYCAEHSIDQKLICGLYEALDRNPEKAVIQTSEHQIRVTVDGFGFVARSNKDAGILSADLPADFAIDSVLASAEARSNSYG